MYDVLNNNDPSPPGNLAHPPAASALRVGQTFGGSERNRKKRTEYSTYGQHRRTKRGRDLDLKPVETRLTTASLSSEPSMSHQAPESHQPALNVPETSTQPPLNSSPSPSPSSLSGERSDAKEKPSAAKLTFREPLQGLRRPSIQFSVHDAESILDSESPKPSRSKLSGTRRLSSPPPPSTYESRVSFDTFDNKDASDFSFSLKVKHKHYNYTRRSRTFLCGTDQNDYSEFALEWLLDELVDDGDEVVCLRVVDKDSKINNDNGLEERRYKTEAHKLMEQIQAKTKDEDKSISLVLEFAIGKVQDTIQRMITIYEPACLIVGTRGRSLNGIQGLLPGSVSKYCLQNSPVPVIVVRPSSKREKKKKKRRADPSRRSYIGIMEKTGTKGGSALARLGQEKLAEELSAEASEQEAEAVARAIGIPSEFAATRILRQRRGSSESTPLSRVTSTRSDYTSGVESPSPEGGLSPDSALLDDPSPELEQLDGGGVSSDEESPEAASEKEAEAESEARDAPAGLKIDGEAS